MLRLDNGAWCYSPAMPTAYAVSKTRDWVGGDMAAWNLVWLTYEEALERFRAKLINMNEFSKEMPPEDYGKVMASASTIIEEISFPGIRQALVGPLPLFIHRFKSGPSASLPSACLFDGTWAERVLRQATRLWESQNDKDDFIPDLKGREVWAVGNVLHVNFGRQK